MTVKAQRLVDLVLILGMVLVGSVPGLAPDPAWARTDIHIGIQIGAPPQLVVVPGTPVSYVPAVPYNYFSYGGQYYLFHAGAWYFASTYNGPWSAIALAYVPRPILAVPVAYYSAPPPYWKTHGPPPWAPVRGHRRKWEDHD
jgi:hypothetical protein